MSAANPIDLLFGGMEKLGPGSDAETLRILRQLPTERFKRVVDAGCGAGRQTMVLASELQIPIHAIDTYEPFLDALKRRAEEAGLAHLIDARPMDMQEIPETFPEIDLLWSEGAAYNIGFTNALTSWARAIKTGGFAVVSELAWTFEGAPPETAQAFFRSAYPDMRHTRENSAEAESAGYKVVHTHTLPPEAWIEDYYDVLGPRAQALCSHADPAVREFARETLQEIEVFNSSAGSYGYVFYVLERS